MNVSVLASAAKTPPDTGASNMTGLSQEPTLKTVIRYKE